jgi:TolB-like protein/AraC-like DNA-binding protein
MTESLPKDQAFIHKLADIVLDNLNDKNFGVIELALKAGVSRYIIHQKLRSTNYRNASRFIREIRLKRAMKLLQEHAGPASDIAYQAGFGSPTYFNKCFHEYYGFTPGEVKTKIIPAEGNNLDYLSEAVNESMRLSAGLTELPVIARRAGRKLILPVIAALVVFIALALYFQKRSSSRYENLSILVLPFKNLSDDKSNQYIADGIMEDVLNNLYHISKLRVISRTTSEYFRDKNLTTKEIADKVGAKNVLEGSIRQYAEKIRISVQLIDAGSDRHLWSYNFDRDLNDIIGIQGEIAMHIANQLNTVLSNDEIRQIGTVMTHSNEAYDSYMRGRFLLNKANSEQRTDITREGLFGSIQHFEQALTADSLFPEAYAGIAQAYLSLSGWGWFPAKEGYQKVLDMCNRAIEIDPDCAEAHAVKGAHHIWGERKFEEGRRELVFALQLNPNYPPAYQWYAQLLMITGPITEARLYVDRALELEPYFWVIQNLSAWIYYFEEKHDKALEACTIAHDLHPGFIENNWLLLLNYAKLGEEENAKTELQTIARTHPESARRTDDIEEAYKISGIEGLFKWLVHVNMHNPVPVAGMTGHPFYIAWWNAILGDREESIHWLEKNMEAGVRLYEFFNLIAANPDFDILRSDPRFITIIDEIGLTQYNTRKAIQ